MDLRALTLVLLLLCLPLSGCLGADDDGVETQSGLVVGGVAASDGAPLALEVGMVHLNDHR